VEDVEDVQTYRFQQKQFRHDSIWAADFEAFTVDDEGKPLPAHE